MSSKNKNTFAIGLDIGGTNTEVGFVDSNGNMLAHSSFPTGAHKAASHFLEQLCAVIDEKLGRLEGKYVCGGIGVAAPNVNYLKGTIESPANLQWGTLNLAKLLKKCYAFPVHMINDANAAALGELGFGVAQKMKNFVVITLGTGLGSGFVINGKIVQGAKGLAGELGHTTAIRDGRECGCGKSGCLESYVSANGIRRTTMELMSNKFYDSELSAIGFSELTARMVAEAASRGDLLALDVLNFTGKVLGRKLADVVACLDPEAFILMGGVANAGEFLLAPTRRYCIENLMPVHQGQVRILLSEMKPGYPAILGASMLVIKALHR